MAYHSTRAAPLVVLSARRLRRVVRGLDNIRWPRVSLIYLFYGKTWAPQKAAGSQHAPPGPTQPGAAVALVPTLAACQRDASSREEAGIEHTAPELVPQKDATDAT